MADTDRAQYGLVGGRLSHSYSKIIHELFGTYTYDLFSMPPQALDGFFTQADFKGVNVTIPYKKDVIPYCARISDAAAKIGSVNTVVKQPDGSLFGYNTDYEGFSSMARRAGIFFGGKKVVILGSGGTSLTAQAVAKDAGAREVVVVSRAGENNYENLGAHAGCEVLINTTPVGMYPNNDETIVSLDDFPNLSGVIDVIYNPLRTKLVLEAKERGIPHTGGLYMLVSQAREAYVCFTGEELPSQKEQDVYRQLLRSVSNIVLIGMPGSGKSLLGKKLARLLGREFIDTDEMVAEKAGMTIPELFARSGEPGFRRYEREAAKECAKLGGKVIATGGGIVQNLENWLSLAQNGRIYFVDRPVGLLETDGRPLSKDRKTVQALYDKRIALYRKYSDAVADNSAAPEEAVQFILEDFNENTCD